MTARPSSILSNARSLLRPRFFLQQAALVLVVALLFVVWLQVPDASVLELTVSFLLALLLLALAGGGETWLILSLCSAERTPRRLLRGTLLLLLGVALWFGSTALLDHVRGSDYLYAGYLNSRAPHSWRHLFSYTHLALWIGWLWSALQGIGACIIAVFAFSATVAAHPVRAMRRMLTSITFWVVALFGTTFATFATGFLIQLTPGHALRLEMFSLILRLSIAFLVDTAVACLLLAILAACVRQVDAP